MHSIRWRLMVALLALVFIPVFFLNRYAIDFFDRFTRKALEQEMIVVGTLAGEVYRSSLEASEWRGMLDRFSEEARSRIRIATVDQEYIYDSRGEAEGLPVAPADWDIIEYSLSTGFYKARFALNREYSLMYFYSAIPLEGDAPPAVMYVSRHTNPIIKAIALLADNQWKATWLALGSALGVAILLGLSLTYRLRRLHRSARAYARGEEGADFHVGGRDEIGQLGEAFHQTTRELASRNIYNEEFVSTMLHEFKTPLTVIRGSAEVLEGGAADDPVQRERFLTRIQYQAGRIDRMVSELNELNRLGAEQRSMEPERVDYPQWVKGILDRLAAPPGLPAATLKRELPDQPIPVRIVPHRMEQVLDNLLSNARRHTPAEGCITVSIERVADGLVRTRVSDTGCGIAATDLPRIFERYFTTQPKDGTSERGRGLGLAIVKTIIRNHRGSVSVDSVPGQGATFSFVLPVDR